MGFSNSELWANGKSGIAAVAELGWEWSLFARTSAGNTNEQSAAKLCCLPLLVCALPLRFSSKTVTVHSLWARVQVTAFPVTKGPEFWAKNVLLQCSLTFPCWAAKPRACTVPWKKKKNWTAKPSSLTWIPQGPSLSDCVTQCPYNKSDQSQLKRDQPDWWKKKTPGPHCNSTLATNYMANSAR